MLLKKCILKNKILKKIPAFIAALGMLSLSDVPVVAENFLFITDIRLAAGPDAAQTLENDGYNVMAVGLNAGVTADKQVYIGYKLNEGDPVTNIILATGEGETLTSGGYTYKRAGDAHVDEGVLEGGGGMLYYTTDKAAGNAIVGLSVLRADSKKDEQLYSITNDGAEVVRDKNGEPADMEQSSENVTIYLAQIRDGLVRPYISDMAVFSGTDKADAVYKAASRGYNYYAAGDIDRSDASYTLIAYDRTADANEAVCDVTAAHSEISENGYIRISDQIDGAEPYYLYISKDRTAGNPVSMLYADDTADITETVFGLWGYGYFSAAGITNAYSYIVNEDSLEELKNNRDIYIKAPVYLLETFIQPYEEAGRQKLNISMLTAKEGLPEGKYDLSGLNVQSYEPPAMERESAANEGDGKHTSSAFGNGFWPVIYVGGAVVVAGTAAAAATLIKRKKKKT